MEILINVAKQYKQNIQNSINYAYNNIDKINYYINENIQILKANEYSSILSSYSESLIDMLSVDNYEKNIIEIFRLIIIYWITQNKFNVIQHKNVSYITTKSDNDMKLKLFCLYIIIYNLEVNLIDKKSYVGIDYEFNKGKIALMQINFDTCWTKDKTIQIQSFIWLVDPTELNDKQKELLIHNIMINDKIYKILHGPESLDIPYMYHQLFNSDKSLITKFTRMIIDTRLLCEYFKINLDDNEKKSCTIYDALLHFGAIGKTKYDELLKVHKNMGPVQYISWNIHKMNVFQTEYALYDVLYLKVYVFSIFKIVNESKYKKLYKYVIELIRFTFLERNKITNIVEYCKYYVDLYNNYSIKIEDVNMTLFSIYNKIVGDLIVEKINIDFLLSVGYIKTQFVYVIKYIIYSILIDNFTVNVNKNEVFRQSLKMDNILQKCIESKYVNIYKLIEIIYTESFNKLLLYKSL